MFMRILTTLFAVAAMIILVALALANRHEVRLVLDPFRREAPALAYSFPYFYTIFAALALGVAIGGIAVWISQGKWRKTARQRTQEAIRWKAEADRLTRERDTHVTAARQLASSTPGKQAQGDGKLLAIAGQ